jgi:ATP-dependent DNA helicase
MSGAKDEKNAGDSKREAAADQSLNSVREETADESQDAEDGDVGLVTEVMAKEEEELYQARLKAEEEEEARKREAHKAFDPNERFSKLDELLTKTQLFSEFLLERMEQITDVCWLYLSLFGFWITIS